MTADEWCKQVMAACKVPSGVSLKHRVLDADFYRGRHSTEVVVSATRRLDGQDYEASLSVQPGRFTVAAGARHLQAMLDTCTVESIRRRGAG